MSSSTHRRSPRILAVAAIAATVLAACGDSDGDGAAVPATDAAVTDTSAVETIDLDLEGVALEVRRDPG